MPLYKSRFMPLFSDPTAPNIIDCVGSEYCHQFIPGDAIHAQFYQTPCGQNELCDPTFTDYTEGADLLGGDGTAGTIVCGNWGVAGDWSCTVNEFTCVPGVGSALSYFPLGLTAGKTYRVSFDMTRSAGSLTVSLSAGPTIVTSTDIDATDSYAFDLFIPTGILTDQIIFNSSTDFNGEITNITVKEVTYTCWAETPSWAFETNKACKSVTGTDDLEESIGAYTTANAYYQLSFTVSGYVSGSITAWVSDVTDQDATVIEANGNYTLYFEPTLAGVVKFTPSSDFIGCIESPDLRELKNDYVIEVYDPESLVDTALYTIQPTYYHQWVTFDWDIESDSFAETGEELPYGCYKIRLYDTCLTSGNQLVTNGGFTDGLNDWDILPYGNAYSVVGGNLEVVFDPMNKPTLITNGDFSGGATGWTVGAGWAIGAGVATHTPGSTAVLSQTITSTPSLTYIQFTISGRTAGSVTVTVSNATSPAFSSNEVITTLVAPSLGGSVTFSINPTTDFDGTIDNVKVVENYGVSAYFTLYNVANPDIVAGNYQASYDLVATANANADGVRIGIFGSSLSNFNNTVGVQTFNISNYVPGTQRVQVNMAFYDAATSILYPGTYTIDDISLVPVAPFEATYTSDCFQYREELPKSKAFVGYCDSPSLGYEFTNTGFRFFERLVCRSFAPSYESDRKIYNYGSGVSGVYYSEITKWHGVYLDAVPETVHDTMAIMLNCDHFLIGDAETNGTEYVARPDDYTPEWDRSGMHGLATVRFEVKPKTDGQFFNRDC